jgi:hypothetical protein
LLANGALLTIKDFHGTADLSGLIPPVLVAIAATCTYVIALQRQRILQRRPLPKHITPRRQVYVLGIAVLLIIIVISFTQLL